MTLIASDGYEYENPTQRLLGNPANSHHNLEVHRIRQAGYAEAEIHAFSVAYRKKSGSRADKYSAGWFAINRVRAQHSVAEYEARTGTPYPAP